MEPVARRHDHLFDRIASFQALNAAAQRAAAGKRRKPGAAAFMANLERELLRLERELLHGDYRCGRYLELVVRGVSPFKSHEVERTCEAPDQTDLRHEFRETCRGRNRRMRKPVLNYPFEVLPLSNNEGGGYAITFHDLPGCRSDRETPEKAIENGLLALSDWLAVATEFGDAIPVPFFR